MNYSRVLVLIAALNEEQGIAYSLESKKTLDKSFLNVRATRFMCDSQVLLHLNYSLEEGS